MWSTNVIVTLCLFQASLLTDANRSRLRERRQAGAAGAPGASYGSNLPSGYNYQANPNLYTNSLQNQPTNNLYSNSLGSSNLLTGLTNPSASQQQQQQQQQQQLQQQGSQQNLYNPNNPSWANPIPAGTNNNNLNPTGAGSNNALLPLPSGSSSYPLNIQGIYPLNNNQLLNNRDSYNPATPAPSNNNNNLYSGNNNLLQNAYGNNNPWVNNNPNMNSYSQNQAGSMFSNPNSYPMYNKNPGRMALSLGLLILSLMILI